jgi:hypothetical protein
VAVVAALVDLLDSRREQQLWQTVERDNQQLGQTAGRGKQQLRQRDGLGRNVPGEGLQPQLNSGTCTEPVLQIITLQ